MHLHGGNTQHKYVGQNNKGDTDKIGEEMFVHTGYDKIYSPPPVE